MQRMPNLFSTTVFEVVYVYSNLELMVVLIYGESRRNALAPSCGRHGGPRHPHRVVSAEKEILITIEENPRISTRQIARHVCGVFQSTVCHKAQLYKRLVPGVRQCCKNHHHLLLKMLKKFMI